MRRKACVRSLHVSCGVEILQRRVSAQPAYDVEPEACRSRDEVITREQAVPYKGVRDAEQLLPVFECVSLSPSIAPLRNKV